MPSGKKGTIEKTDKARLEESICMHIFSVSAALVGACATIIGIIQVVIKTGNETTFIDDLVAFNALLFLTSCLLAYWAMRKQGTTRMFQIENIADTIFILGLVLMVIICGIIAIAVTWHHPVAMSLH